ncbi:MAG: hypothetical protein GKR89_05095 [Candidatus Latescibacteria bacterium]|nr:hypothetical protein [Candidatus Latescibacterota bacterium]
MINRPDLVPAEAPESVEIVQLTHGDLPSSHVYMEAQIFAPDSRRFVLHESAHPHGSDKDDSRHCYLLCDLEDDCSLRAITHEMGATAPSISPDGRYLYYFIDQTEVGGGRLTLKRVGLDGSGRETVLVVDRPVAGPGRYASRLYPLSTIRADGAKLALSCFLGDGQGESLWGLLVFDVEAATAEVILQGASWCNIHPQYCRSTEPEYLGDILVQENHGNQTDARGQFAKLTGGAGADIHVIGEDGRNFRDLPWGRDGDEFCQGHQCWRGESSWAITSTSVKSSGEQQLIESRAVEHVGHLGLATPGGQRNDLSRAFAEPHFYHFATDRQARRFVTDSSAQDGGGRVYVADFGVEGEDALANWTCIAEPRSSWTKQAHIHPFLSPDGQTAFFNSDESGLLQAYMVRGL